MNHVHSALLAVGKLLLHYYKALSDPVRVPGPEHSEIDARRGGRQADCRTKLRRIKVRTHAMTTTGCLRADEGTIVGLEGKIPITVPNQTARDRRVFE